MLYRAIRPLLFRMDPEKAHRRTLALLSKVQRIPWLLDLLSSTYSHSSSFLSTTLWGIRFPNPIGLAAGFDKSAEAIVGLGRLGFGFLEVGTVTRLPQEGNPRPRLFRFPQERALVNRMGFNNPGCAVVASRLARLGRPPVPVGVNIGRSRSTPNEEAPLDYAETLRTLAPYVDFVVLNVSSPNTPNLRSLEEPENLRSFLRSLGALLSQGGERVPPLLVKISPDVETGSIPHLASAIEGSGVQGIVATNTTVQREGLGIPGSPAGGISGAPLRERSTEVVRLLYSSTEGRIPIVGVGGIFSASDAYEKIVQGASLVEIYTGLVFEGPSIVRRIAEGLEERLRREGWSSLSEAVGSAHRR